PRARRRCSGGAALRGARAHSAGEGEPGSPATEPRARVSPPITRCSTRIAPLCGAQLNMRARWTIAAWPTDHWAGQVYPNLKPLAAKRRLAKDLLRFCRLTDDDGKGTSGWLKHLRTLDRRSTKLSKLGLARLELRGPGTELDVAFVP